MHRACRAVGITAAFSLAGLSYCAVLLPEFFDNTMPLAVRVLRILCLGCGLSFLAFWGMGQWYGGLLEKLHEQARQHVLHHLQPGQSPALVPDGDRTLSRNGTAAEGGNIIRLPKAS